jgi:hypothetical protein
MKKDNAFDLLTDKSELIFLIDRLLTDLLNETRTLPRLSSTFDCKDVPNISVHDYLARNVWLILGIGKYSHCSSGVFVAALIYIDRFQERI